MNPNSKAFLWAGRILTALPILIFAMSAAMKLSADAKFMSQWAGFGFKPEQATTIGILELLCVIVYAIPRTASLGAVLLTGYLGGAVVTHLRSGEPVFAPVLIGAIVWGGLYFRDARVRDLLPLRKA
jgi:hypothetical protein